METPPPFRLHDLPPSSASRLACTREVGRIAHHAPDAVNGALTEVADEIDRLASLELAGLAIIPDPVLSPNAATIAKLALIHKLPSVGDIYFAEAGGLFGFEEDYPAMARRSASYG